MVEYEEEVEEAPTLHSVWGWYSTIHFLASENILKMDEIVQLPLLYVFNFLSYNIEFNKEKERQFKEMSNQNRIS